MIKSKKDLMNYRNTKKSIEILKGEIEELNQMLVNIAAPPWAESVKSSGGITDAQSAILDKIKIKQDEYIKLTQEIVKYHEEIEAMINTLDKIEYKNLLKARYILCLSWEGVAELLNRSVRHTTRMHGEALAEYDRIATSQKNK